MITINHQQQLHFGTVAAKANLHGFIVITIGDTTITIDRVRALGLAKEIEVASDHIVRVTERGAA